MGTQGDRVRSLTVQSFDQDEMQLPKIRVSDPVTHEDGTDGRRFTTYNITVRTTHHSFHLPYSSIRRRFSEVAWLYAEMRDQLKTKKLPRLPPKTMFAKFDVDFLEQRQNDVEKFLNDLVRVEGVIADISFHLFLQTDLTTEEISRYLAGDLDEEWVRRAWRSGGRIHSSRSQSEQFAATVEEIRREDLHRRISQLAAEAE